jgi:hypothetical protein
MRFDLPGIKPPPPASTRCARPDHRVVGLDIGPAPLPLCRAGRLSTKNSPTSSTSGKRIAAHRTRHGPVVPGHKSGMPCRVDAKRTAAAWADGGGVPVAQVGVGALVRAASSENQNSERSKVLKTFGVADLESRTFGQQGLRLPHVLPHMRKAAARRQRGSLA